MRVSIAGAVATAILGASAASASASDVWMWACHGPSGQALTTPSWSSNNRTEGGTATDLNNGCSAAGTNAGVTLASPTKGTATVKVTVPDGMNATRVRILRRANGLGAAGAVTYTATYGPADAPGTAIPDTDFSATSVEFPVSGAGDLNLKVSCADTCTGSLDVLAVAFLVSDSEAPYALGVGRNNPVVTSRDKWTDPNTKVEKWWIEEAPLTFSGRDSGVGLDRAVVTLSGPGIPGAREFAIPLNDAKCTDLSPGDTVNDRPLDRSKCAADAGGSSAATFNWRDVIPATGTYTRSVVFYDVAGNQAAALSNDVFDVEVIGIPVSTRTLSIGTDPVTIQDSPNGPGTTPGGGVQGAQSTQCRTPRLSVVLSSKPLRITKGTPVLKYKKAYKFTGRLTCVINGKRRTAPKRTKVSILNKVGKKTVRKPNTAIRDKGAVNVKLAFVSSRTVIFRYTNAAGQKSEVKIKVRVSKSKK